MTRHYVRRDPRERQAPAPSVHHARIDAEYADPILRWSRKKVGRPFGGRGWFHAWRVRAAIEEVTQ